MIKIGYQGIEGSNAEQAAKDLVKKLNLADVEYVPLVDSPHVIKAMKTGETDYGVCAVYNSVAGMVLETFFATNGVELFIRGETTMNIHHCLFKKRADIPDDDSRVRSVAYSGDQTVRRSYSLQLSPAEEYRSGRYGQGCEGSGGRRAFRRIRRAVQKKCGGDVRIMSHR